MEGRIEDEEAAVEAGCGRTRGNGAAEDRVSAGSTWASRVVAEGEVMAATTSGLAKSWASTNSARGEEMGGGPKANYIDPEDGASTEGPGTSEQSRGPQESSRGNSICGLPMSSSRPTS